MRLDRMPGRRHLAGIPKGYRFDCRHVVPDCEGVVHGDTREEVLQAVAEHASDVHDMDELSAEIIEKVRTESRPDRAARIPWSAVIFILGAPGGVAIHFVSPVHLLPAGWVGLAVGVPIIVVGVLLWTWTLRTQLQARTATYVGDPTTTLITYGPFRFSRNPMYLSYGILLVGIALAVNTAWVLAVVPVLLLVGTVDLMLTEERYLQQKFGEEYSQYRARVRRWL